MTDSIKKKLNEFKAYNMEEPAKEIFGLDSNTEYDALIVAPSFTPDRLGIEDYTVTRESSYTAGYDLEKDGLKIAWIKTASGAGNLIDHLAICSELKAKKIIFLGAVGALKKEIELATFCTPSYCISGVGANAYLNDDLRQYKRFEKVYPSNENFIEHCIKIAEQNGYQLERHSVYCTDSIVFEYAHLPEIKGFDTDLIEMETSSFYLVTKELEIPSIALLLVSDNSASGVALVGRTEEQTAYYQKRRKEDFQKLVFAIIKSEF